MSRAPNIDPGTWSWSLTTLQITGSSVSGPLHAVTVGGEATVEGEVPQGEDAFGAPGIVFRPRPPETVTGADGQQYRVGAEAIGGRMSDRLTPFTWRDLRLNLAFPAPKEGTIALVGYGGAFLTFDDTPAGDSIATLYVPYEKVNGVATKCHTIILDPAQESIGIVHGEGCAIALDSSKKITLRADGDTSVVVGPGICQITAASIVLKGNVTVGGNAAAGVPFTGGPAMLPCPSLFLSPV